MAVITMTINDELVSGREGQTLLELIRERGIKLPPQRAAGEVSAHDFGAALL